MGVVVKFSRARIFSPSNLQYVPTPMWLHTFLTLPSLLHPAISLSLILVLLSSPWSMNTCKSVNQLYAIDANWHRVRTAIDANWCQNCYNIIGAWQHLHSKEQEAIALASCLWLLGSLPYRWREVTAGPTHRLLSKVFCEDQRSIRVREQHVF